MATLESSIKLHDGMSRVLRSMNNTMNILINSFQNVKDASNNCINTASLEKARSEIQKTSAELQLLENQLKHVGDSTQRVDAGFRTMGKLGLGIGSVMKVFDFAKQSMDMSDVQRKSEIQLQTVLANVGASADAFERLTNKASEIQSKGIYGDESMIAGAAELATYFKDTQALEKMMDTLSNFAMGMSGGGAIDPKQMVQYATQLGKAANGTFGGLSIKGFTFTDAEEAILKGNNELEKAEVLQRVIGASWDKLYEKMSNTPEGRLISFNNALGDMREEIGNKLYGVIDKLMQKINETDSMGNIKKVMDSIGNGIANITYLCGQGIVQLINFSNHLIANWNAIEPAMIGIIGIISTLEGVTMSAAIAEKYYSFNLGISAFWEKAITAWKQRHIAATIVEAAELETATGAQIGYNAALFACPLTWVVVGIMAVVSALYLCVAVWNYFTGENVSATGIIAGSFMWLGSLVANIFIGLATAGAWVATKIHNGFVHFGQGFLNLVADLQDGWSNFATSMADAFVNAINTAIHAWNGLVDLLPDKVKSTLNLKIGDVQSFGKIGSSGQSTRNYANQFKLWEDPKFNFIDMGKAYQKGYAWGDSLQKKFEMDPFKNPQLNALNKIANNTSETASNTGKMKNNMEMNDVDLKYMHDIAEREVINRFTTAEIKLDMTNNNNISSDIDIDTVITKISDSITESMLVAAEGIHA